ncbi:MAG: hypothetical protein K2W82_08570 [Candidatus Obscuribacterales bacterium]|nr:hypothetical protein [Candidatus Obscuribacterales bacterium]
MRKTLSIIFSLALVEAAIFAPAYGQAINKPVAKPTVETLQTELRLYEEQLKSTPNSAPLHFKIGEVQRNLGNKELAAKEYAKACELDPAMYVAFHQLALNTNEPQLLDPAIEKLTTLSQERPKELMLRVALSELLEKRGNFYQAARALIDITYANAVPEKYKNKVTARIHFLLTQQKKSQLETVQETASSEEELDLVPAPLPATTNKRRIASAKIKDAKEVKGMGNVPLLP